MNLFLNTTPEIFVQILESEYLVRLVFDDNQVSQPGILISTHVEPVPEEMKDFIPKFPNNKIIFVGISDETLKQVETISPEELGDLLFVLGFPAPFETRLKVARISQEKQKFIRSIGQPIEKVKLRLYKDTPHEGMMPPENITYEREVIENINETLKYKSEYQKLFYDLIKTEDSEMLFQLEANQKHDFNKLKDILFAD